RVTRIVGAGVAVVADHRRARLADAAGADVAGGPNGAVDGGRGVGRVDTARRRVTRIVGAGVAVVADHRRAGLADAAGADVAGRTGVPVVAGRGVGRVDTARRRVTRIVGAGVAVVADHRRAGLADAAGADVA